VKSLSNPALSLQTLRLLKELLAEVQFDEIRVPPLIVTFRLTLSSLVFAKERPPIDASWPRQISQMIQECWQHSPKERPSFDDISAELLFLDLNDE